MDKVNSSVEGLIRTDEKQKYMKIEEFTIKWINNYTPFWNTVIDVELFRRLRLIAARLPESTVFQIQITNYCISNFFVGDPSCF